MSINPYKDLRLNRLDGGLWTEDEESRIGDEFSPNLLNIDFVKKGSFEIRKGISTFGGEVVSVSGIKSLECFNRSDGLQIPWRSWSTDIEYFNRQTSAWALLSSGFSANLPFGYASYDGSFYFCNGLDAMFSWNGQYDVIADAHAASATVLEVGGLLTDWLSAGEAIIETQPVYYGSRTSGTLSAMTGVSAVIAANAEVAQAPTSSRGWSAVSSVPRGNILHVDTDRLYVAGVSSYGGIPSWETFYYSRLGDPTDFTPVVSASSASPATDTDAGRVKIGDGGGYITGIKSISKGNILIAKNHALKGFQFISLDATTTAFPKIASIANSYNSGVVTHRGMVNVESDVFFVSPKNGMRSALAETLDSVNTKDVSDKITPSVDILDHVSASCRYYQKDVYWSSKKSGSNYNNRLFKKSLEANEGKGAWTYWKGWNVNDWMEFEGNLYYGAASEKTVYKANTGYLDNGVAYESEWKSKLFHHGFPQEMKHIKACYIEGYITQAGVVSAIIYYNGLSADYKQKVIYGNAAYVDPTQTEIFGDSVFGGAIFGGATNSADVVLSKFRVRMDYNLQDVFSYQIGIKSNLPGTVYRIDEIVPYVERLDGDVFPVSNII